MRSVVISRGLPLGKKTIAEKEWKNFVANSNDYEEVKEAHGRNPMTGETITVNYSNTAKCCINGLGVSLDDGYLVIAYENGDDLQPFAEPANHFNAQLYDEEEEIIKI